MKWEEKLKCNLALLKEGQQEEIYKMCMNAYLEGRVEERKKAREAHRLRCCKLFGNRCMDFRLFKKTRNGTCDGNCLYIRRFEAELYRLDN